MSSALRGTVPSCQLGHRPLRLLQPEPHVHLAVHRRGGGEVLVGLLALARAPVQLAEAEVAVGDEGAHAEFVRDAERLAIARLEVSRSGGSGWTASSP
jgi:hypothetical protein